MNLARFLWGFDGNNKDPTTKGWQRGLFFFFLLSIEASKERPRKSNNCIHHCSPIHLPADLSCEIPLKILASSHLPIANVALLNVRESLQFHEKDLIKQTVFQWLPHQGVALWAGGGF